MRYDTEHKERTRKRVLREAANAIRVEGPDRIGVAARDAVQTAVGRDLQRVAAAQRLGDVGHSALRQSDRVAGRLAQGGIINQRVVFAAIDRATNRLTTSYLCDRFFVFHAHVRNRNSRMRDNR